MHFLKKYINFLFFLYSERRSSTHMQYSRQKCSVVYGMLYILVSVVLPKQLQKQCKFAMKERDSRWEDSREITHLEILQELVYTF